MGSADTIANKVSDIVIRCRRKGDEPFVVVSAMSGVTNILLKAANLAAGGNVEASGDLVDQLIQKHRATVSALVRDPGILNSTLEELSRELEGLRNFLRAISVIKEVSFRSHDSIIALGEKFSACIFAAHLNDRGEKAEYINLEAVIKKDRVYQDDTYWDRCAEDIAARIAKIEPGVIPVITGFFGGIDGGIINRVGRGYSDYCASVVGAAIKADEIQIWTDVDGVLSTNPAVVPTARTLPAVSYDEMAELSRFGAKVLHPFSVRPALLSNIPLRILNTFSAEHPGTTVTTEQVAGETPFKSIAYKKGITIIHLATPRMLMAHGFFEKVTACFSRHEVQIDLVATSEVSISFTVDEGPADIEPLIAELRTLGGVSVLEKQSMICLVGHELQGAKQIQGRVFSVLNSQGIAVSMISQSSSQINLSFVVSDEQCEKAVRLLHQDFFGA